MKIIYGITKSNFGGAQRYVFDLARHARKEGHEVAVICGGNGPLVEKLLQNDIKVILLPHLKRDISLVDEIRSLHFIFRTLFEEQPDVFHTNSSKMGGLGNVAAFLAGVRKIVFTAHGWAFNEPRPKIQKIIIKFFVWLTILFSHKTPCVSVETKRQVENLPFMKSKLVVIYNGLEHFDLVPRQTGGFVVGTIAELHKIKGLDVLLHAWAEFIEKHPQAKLVIMGEGEERNNLEALTHELGIGDSVSFKGQVDNARTQLLDFDIFVLPSRSENLPYTILEAGFAGLPVIASRVGGIPEIIKDGESGLLIPPEDSLALYTSLIKLAESQGLRQRLGNNLKETVVKNFSVNKMVAETLEVYL